MQRKQAGFWLVAARANHAPQTLHNGSIFQNGCRIQALVVRAAARGSVRHPGVFPSAWSGSEEEGGKNWVTGRINNRAIHHGVSKRHPVMASADRVTNASFTPT